MAGDRIEGCYQLILSRHSVLIGMRCPLRVFRILDPYLCGLINNRGEKSTLIQSGMKCNRVHLGKNSIYSVSGSSRDSYPLWGWSTFSENGYRRRDWNALGDIFRKYDRCVVVRLNMGDE